MLTKALTILKCTRYIKTISKILIKYEQKHVLNEKLQITSNKVQRVSEIKSSHNQMVPYGWDAHLTILS